MNKCTYCKHYIDKNSICEYCEFEYHHWYSKDDWDIFGMDDDYEWSHLQIQYRLEAKGIECLFADIWYDENIAYIVGVKAKKERVASVLGVNNECVYDDSEHGLMILNLFQEKYLRGLL